MSGGASWAVLGASWAVLGASWAVLGAIWGRIWDRFGAPEPPKIMFSVWFLQTFMNSRDSVKINKNPMENYNFQWFRGLNSTPRRPQIGPKSASGGSWGPRNGPRPLGTPSKTLPGPRGTPPDPPGPPGTPQRRPQGLPGTAQDLPKDYPRLPGASREAPRSLPGRPRKPPGSPPEPPGTPQEPPRPPPDLRDLPRPLQNC